MSLLSSIRVLDDWLGAGGLPVPQEQANHRAAICLECPENREPGWWDRVANEIASAIRRTLSMKNDLKYSVNSEEKLGMCRKCGCCIALKVHAPIEHIKDHTEDFTIYPAWCWQRIEAAQ